jgi:diacylglycerol kinase family enzyme
MDLILYNPLSNNKKSNIQTNKLIRKYKKNKTPFRLKNILKIQNIKEYLDTKKDIDKVILLGGDGTINRFVNETVNYDFTQDIYLKPNGSGNDYMRSLRGSDEAPQYVMESMLDTGIKTNFINGAGIGVDGYVLYLMEKSANKRFNRYIKSTIKALIQYIPEPITINVDGKEHVFKKAYLISINNGKYIGSGMKMAPQANIHDENLDVLVVHSIRKIFLLFIFLTIYTGKHLKFKKYIFHTKGKHIKATFTSPQIYQTDGECYYDVTSIDVKSTGKTIHFRAFE